MDLTPAEVVLLTLTSFMMWFALYTVVCCLQPRWSAERNSRIVVIVHAVTILIMSSIFGFLYNPWPFTHPGGKSNKYEISTMVVCNGYFLYDFLRGIFSGGKRSKAMSMHHVICIMFTSVSLLSGVSGTEIGFSLFLAELTNPMLQIRWLMRDAGITEGILYEVNQYAFFVTFVVVRVGIGSYWLYHYIMHPLPHAFFKLGGVLLYSVSIVFMGQILAVAYHTFAQTEHSKKSENLPQALEKTKL